MKRKLISLLVLTLATSTVYAENNKDAAAAMAGKWSNSATHQTFSINKRGIVGLNASVCGEIFQEEFSMANGSKWLTRASDLARNKDIPQSQYKTLSQKIDGNKSYAYLQSSCGESGDQFILASPETMMSISCSEGSCIVVHYVRAH